MEQGLERFLRYVAIQTTSSEKSGTHPSTPGQSVLARLLAEELREIGLVEIDVDSHALVMATLPASPGYESLPVIGLIAHLDTSPSVSGENIHPEVIEYKGGAIPLKNGMEIPEDDALRQCLGHRLVITDGTTLLGADDKSGIAAIMTAMEQVKNGVGSNGLPFKHGKIRVAFTPDEEIGEGALFFDTQKFGADWAVTVDGEMPGKVNCETFSALKADLTVEGVDIHPGSAKGIMINASVLLSEMIARLPKELSPEQTSGYEPFIHPYEMNATVASGNAVLILRAFEDQDMVRVCKALNLAVDSVKKEYPGAKIQLTYTHQYSNMRQKLDAVPQILAQIENAVRKAGADPQWVPIRGGTDGSLLTERGLPTPNLFTGGHHFHSVKEWLSVDMLDLTIRAIIELITVD